MVKQCNRLGCETIMCRRYGQGYGYLCDDCYDELVRLGVTQDAVVFMNTPKQPLVDHEISNERFNKLFPIGDGQ